MYYQCDVAEFNMTLNISKKINQNVLATVESTLTASTLDDLLEASLSHLLTVNDLKTAVIQLFNKTNKLVTVATARKNGAKDKIENEIVVQSWLLDSTVEHTRRKTQFNGLTPVISIPLMESGGLLGFFKYSTE